ncbi:hypothetical protein, partial [Salmonella enterica]|uniref:hypothetical protein n=1 Tax=Salmonella enterica TaxID=28901 RepID=UPI0020C23636
PVIWLKIYQLFLSELSTLPGSTTGQTAVLPTVEPVKVDSSLKNRLYLFKHITGMPRAGHIMNVAGGAATWDYTGI